MNGYDQILAADHIPSYFIYFNIDPSNIDVNIHPSKTEVKFEDERSIWQILLASVKKAIGKNNLSPSLDFGTEGVIDIPVLSKDTEIKQPSIDTNPAYNPFAGENCYDRKNGQLHTWMNALKAGNSYLNRLPDILVSTPENPADQEQIHSLTC